MQPELKDLTHAPNKSAAARKLFDYIIKEHECWDGQICICTKTFRRTIQAPILNLIKEMEAAAQ